MSKYNSLLKKVEVFEKLAVYGDRKEFLNSLGQAAPWTQSPYAGNWDTIELDQNPSNQENVIELDDVPPTQQRQSAPAPKANPEVKHAQEMLNALGYQPALVPDGILGTLTKAALRWYAKALKVPNMADQHLIAGLNMYTDRTIGTLKQKLRSFDPEFGATSVPGPDPNQPEAPLT